MKLKSFLIGIGIVFLLLNIASAGNPTYTAQYPPSHDDTYVKSTTYEPANFRSYYATNPALTLTGTGTSVSWLSTNGITTNQRFHIDLSSAKIIRRVYYEPYHDEGSTYGRGAKNFTFWGSNASESFAELTYTTDTGWTQLTTNQSTIDEHILVDQADPKFIIVTNTVEYRYYAFKFADNYGGTLLGVRHIELQTEDAPANIAPTITANITKPDTVYTDTDWELNITATDIENETFTAYTQFYINGSLSGSELPFIILNDSNTNVANLSSSNFGKGATLIAEIWVSDVECNSTKINSSQITVQNSAPVVLLNFPENSSTGNLVIVTLNVTVTDADGDIMNVSFYSGYTISNDTWLSDDEEIVGQYQGEFTKLKTIEIVSLSPSPTSLRIYREQYKYNASVVSSKIGKNGAIITAEWQGGGTEYESRAEDIEFIEGDTVEFWGLANSGEAKFRNFRVLGINSFIGDAINISNGSYATYEWSGLGYNTTYNWYASVTDGIDRTSNEVLNFVTYSPLMNGTVKDSSNVVVNNATVIIIDQSDNTIVGTTNSNLTGGWFYYIGNIGTYLVVTYDPNNSTRDGDADPHIIVS